MKHQGMIQAAASSSPRGGDLAAAAAPALACGQIEPLVKKEISLRARRGTFLPASLFSDPAWDMLLALYRAQLRQHRVSVTSLSLASQVPATTAFRWISVLELQGLTLRHPDRLDRRRMYIELTPAGFAAMTAYFSLRGTHAEEGPLCAR